MPRKDKSLCSVCETSLSQDNAYKNKHNKTGLYSRCKDCWNSYQRQRYAADPEPTKTRCRKYTAENPEKSRQTRRNHYKRNHGVYVAKSAKRRSLMKTELTPVEKEWLQLYYIESRAMSKATGVVYEVDHVKPLAKGGEHAPWNMQLLTAEENKHKADKWHSAAA